MGSPPHSTVELIKVDMTRLRDQSINYHLSSPTFNHHLSSFVYHSWVPMDIPADSPALFVEELADTLPTCVCYHVEAEGKFAWSLPYYFDSISQAIDAEGGGQSQLELNKFTKGIAKRLQQQDVKDLLGNCFHARSADGRWETKHAF